GVSAAYYACNVWLEDRRPACHGRHASRMLTALFNGREGFATKKWRDQMPFQMIDREKWFAGPDGQTFRRRISYQQRTGKSRSACGCKGVDFIDRNVRGRHCALK